MDVSARFEENDLSSIVEICGLENQRKSKKLKKQEQNHQIFHNDAPNERILPVTMSCVAYLGNAGDEPDCKMGGTEFPNIGITVPVVTGTCIIWPNRDLLPPHGLLTATEHRGLVTTEGSRLSLAMSYSVIPKD